MPTTRSIGAEVRRERLLEMLGRDGGIRLELAAESLGVSAMTVRRDLDDLADEGLLRRVRGGAVPAMSARPFGERRNARLGAKSVIAQKAAALVPTSGSIAIDASTTAGGLSSVLNPVDSLTVVTNSYENFLAVAPNPAVSAILTGGEMDMRTGSFVGPIACQGASAVLYRRFFASANAVDALVGSSEVSLLEMQVKRALAVRAQDTVLLVDSSKLDRRSVAVGFDWSEIEVLITELDPSDEKLDRYRDLVQLL
jgi:DeoR family fructose operon transcriptional repressor